jgi:hypothetical protein
MPINESNSGNGYSANVSLKLRVQNEMIDVAKVGPSRIVLREAKQLPNGTAELIITVGNKTTLQNVILTQGDNESQVNYW